LNAKAQVTPCWTSLVERLSSSQLKVIPKAFMTAGDQTKPEITADCTTFEYAGYLTINDLYPILLLFISSRGHRQVTVTIQTDFAVNAIVDFKFTVRNYPTDYVSTYCTQFPFLGGSFDKTYQVITQHSSFAQLAWATILLRMSVYT
jgi:hypothetical protein